MSKVANLFVSFSLVIPYIMDLIFRPFYKTAMKHCGKHVYLRPLSSDFKGLWNISIGDYTSIPKGLTFYCTEAPLTIGNKVIFGPAPTIITGDHRIDVIGNTLSIRRKNYQKMMLLSSLKMMYGAEVT